MVSDQANTRNPIFLLILALIVLIMTICIVMLYLSARQNSIAKIQPYVIQLQVGAGPSIEPGSNEHIFVQYDYGYGFNPGHQQTLTFQRGVSSQILEFTVSAWKPLRSLRLTSNGTTPIDISKVRVSKVNLQYETNKSGVVNANNALIVENVNTNLFEVAR